MSWIVERSRHRMRVTDKNRWLALYLYRVRYGARPRRGLVNRLRRVMFPRARKAGPTFPSIRPSAPPMTKCI